MNVGVHRTHCCLKHGCKYGNRECPVEAGTVVQAHPCEWCQEVAEEEAEIRRDERERIANRILGELVCCDIYEQIAATGVVARPRDIAVMLDLTYHSTCYYGGWAAALARQGQ